MKKVSFFAAAAAVTALIATPALAQDSAKPGTAMHGKSKHMKHSSKHMKHSARMQSRDAAYMRTASQQRLDNRGDWNARNDWNNNGWDNRRSEFWPGDVVGGAIGTAGAIASGAVNTAGAIATAPFGGPSRDSYAYRDTYAYDGGPNYAESYTYNGVAIPYSSNYAARNGFVCQPGTFIQGTRTLCQ